MQLPEVISVKRLFVAVIVIKIASSLLGWWVHSPWVLGFAVPISVMAAYILIGLYRRDVDELSDEKFADSCYYLGFIFTISSIIISLFDLPDIGNSGKLGEIAIRFGAAMVSTVFGLIVRVYLVNFRKDILDISKSMEEDLLNAAKLFRAQLELTVEQLKSFNMTVDDAAKNTIARVEIGITETAKANTDEISNLFRSVATQIEEATDASMAGVRGSSADLQKSIQLYTTSLVVTAKHHEEKLGGFSENLASKLDQVSLAFVDSLSDLRVRLEAFSNDLNAQLNAVNFPSAIFKDQLDLPVYALRNSIESVTSHVNDMSGGIKANSENISAALMAVPGSVADATAMIRAAVEDQRKTVDTVNAQEVALLKLAKNIANLDTVLQKTTEGMAEQRQVISSLGEGVVQIVGDHKSLQEFSSQQAAVVSEMTNQVERLASALFTVATDISVLNRDSADFKSALSANAEQQQSLMSGGFDRLSVLLEELVIAVKYQYRDVSPQSSNTQSYEGSLTKDNRELEKTLVRSSVTVDERQ